MTPQLHTLTFTPESPSHFVHTISSLLSLNECNSLILQHTNLIPSNVTAGTKRDRKAFDDEELSDLIWERLQPFYGSDRIVDEEGQVWATSGLNTKWRLCRYGKGKFSPHRDGRRLASVDEQSFSAGNIYLKTVSEEQGGATRFLRQAVEFHPGSVGEADVLGKVQPVMRSAAVFRDSLWHDGEELMSGEKYLLRTDITYAREVLFDFNMLYAHLSNEEKGKKALGLAETLEDAGSNEEAVGWYKRAFRLCPDLER